MATKIPKHIIYIASSYPPNPIGADQILIQKNVHEFIASGIQVTIIGVRHLEGKENAPAYMRQEGNPRVRWVGFTKDRRFISRLRSWCQYKFRGMEVFDENLECILKELRDEMKKGATGWVVLSQYPSDDAIDLGYIFSKSLKLPWVHIHNDPYPLHLIPPPYQIQAPRGLDILGTQSKILRAFIEPERVIFPCKRLLKFEARILPDIARMAEDRWRVISHMGIRPLKPTESNGIFRVCHVGRLYSTRNPEGFIRAWNRFIAKVGRSVETEFLQIGRIWERPMSMLEVAQGLRVIPTTSYEESLRWMQRASVLLLIEAPIEEGIFLPSKLGDYVGCGKPILSLSPAEGTIADLFSEFGGGIRIDPTDDEKIYHALLMLFENWHGFKSNPDINCRMLQEYFHPDRICELYLNVMKEIF